MKRFCVAIAFFIASLACSPSHVRVMHQRPSFAETKIVKIFHADTRFNDTEKQIIIGAIERINVQTNGVAKIGVIFDLDWDKPETLVQNYSHEQIISERSWATSVKKMDEQQVKGFVVLGWCDVNFSDPTYATRVYLVADRLMTEAQYTHVVMHELFHSLRMEHIAGNADSIMLWKTLGETPTTCMSRLDAQEFCRVYHCKIDEINFCE